MKFIHNLKFFSITSVTKSESKSSSLWVRISEHKKERNESASNIRITVKLPFFIGVGNIAVTFHINLNYSWILYYVDAEF